MAIIETIQSVIRAQLDVPPDATFELTDDPITKFNGDSLSRVELIMALEDEYNIEIPDEDAVKCITVGDYVTLLEKYI